MMPATRADNAGWAGALALRCVARHGRTVLARRDHCGPLTVQQVLYPEGDAGHIVVLHPPGGLVGGDRLKLSIACEPAAVALVTTPASGKVYRSDGRLASQDLDCTIASGASLEWLPQDTIVFNGSDYRALNTIHLARGAAFVSRDIVTLGRPAHGDHYAQGRFEQRVRVYLDEELLLNECLRWSAPSSFMRAPWGLAGYTVCGALLAYPADAAVLACVRALPGDGLLIGASRPGGLLSLRCLGDDAAAVRDYLAAVWQCIRPAVVGRPASVPRIWQT